MVDQNIEQTNAESGSLGEAKKVEFYSQGVAAWFNSALEHDKSLLTLSVAGIGVLISIKETVGKSICSVALYFGAILCFMFCLVFILMIFKRNKIHIIDVFNGLKTDDPILTFLDTAASISFFVAMLLAAAFGVLSVVNVYNVKGEQMAKEDVKKGAQTVAVCDSVNGVAKLSPLNESFNKMANMQKSYQGMSQLQGNSTNQTQANQPTSQNSSTSQSQLNPAQANKPK